MKKLKKQSILTFFSATTVLLFFVVLIFNSLAIQHLIFSFHNIKANQNVFSNIHNIFTIIESNGYERGRVNVILNYQGKLDEMHEFRDFVSKHRQIGNATLQELLTTLPNSGLKYDLNTFNKLKSSLLSTKKLQKQYLTELALPFVERNSTLDDKWFTHMSQQMNKLSTLTYSLIEKNSMNPVLKPYAKMIYQLTMLRNHTGPVVSYLKAATFNRSSLTLQRIEELKYKKIIFSNQMNRLEIVSEEILDSKILNKIHYFDNYYQNQVMITADYIANNDEIEFKSPVDFFSYLENGINALEQLNTITNDIMVQTTSMLENKYQEALLKLVSSILLSLLIFIILLTNILRIYKLVYRRIIEAGKLMHV